MQFRAAIPEDIPLLRELAQKIWRACYPDILSTEQIEFMLERMYSERQIRDEIETGVTWELILDDEPRAAGFLSFHVEEDGRMKLNKLYVLPELQGKGIGRGALDHVSEAAAALGASTVWMQVNKRNERAIAAYRKAGFGIAQEAVFDLGRGFVMDDFLMEKDVRSPARPDDKTAD